MDVSPTIRHDVAWGVKRLLSAPRDLPGAIQWKEPGPSFANADVAHRSLFERYAVALHWASAIAVPWWEALVRHRMERGASEREAIRASYKLRPAGPAARPEVVWVVRTHWLACDRLNRMMLTDRRIPPEVMLLRWLRSPEHDLLIAVLSGMPCWPLGFDEQGSFV